MAVECTGCGRRNNDDALSCLYCGIALEPRERAPDGRRSNPQHLVWIPEAGPEPARALQRVLHVDAFRARLLAQSAVPRILRTLGDASSARALQRQARAAGLRTLLVDDHTLSTHPPAVAVEEAVLDPGQVVLRGGWGAFRVPGQAVELLVTSQVQQRRVRRSARISMLASEPGTTPGVPRVVKESSTTQDHRRVLDVYPAGEQRALRVREEDTLLAGDDMPQQPSSLLRFLRLVQALQQLAPDAAFDDRFALFDDLDADQAERSDARSGVTILDGITRFARYSRLLWMARHPPDPEGP